MTFLIASPQGKHHPSDGDEMDSKTSLMNIRNPYSVLILEKMVQLMVNMLIEEETIWVGWWEV